MRKIAIFAIPVALTASFVFAQTADEFDAWMRTIDEKNQALQNNIAAKNAKAATDDAKVLQDTFKLIEDSGHGAAMPRMLLNSPKKLRRGQPRS